MAHLITCDEISCSLAAMARTMLRPRKRRTRRASPTFQPGGFTLAEVAAQAGIQPRTVAFYIREGLLPPARFRGPATRYEREHLVRIVAIKKLQREEKLSLAHVKRRLRTLTPEQIEELGGGELANGDAAKYSGAAGAPTVATGAVASGPTSSTMTTWERLEILPGIELLVRSNVSAHARRVVREIEAQFLEADRQASAGAAT